MKEPFRFLLPKDLRRFLRPAAYRLLSAPHGIKIREILKLKDRYQLKTFVETGTYLGDTIDSVVNQFDKVYSVELDKKLYQRAKKLFKNDISVHLVFGDSGTKIKEILREIKEPALFWLDAHYSGAGTARGKKDSPVSQELRAILNHKIKKHIILIDDARLFIGQDGYPKLAALRAYLKNKYPAKRLKVDNDIIRII